MIDHNLVIQKAFSSDCGTIFYIVSPFCNLPLTKGHWNMSFLHSIHTILFSIKLSSLYNVPLEHFVDVQPVCPL